MNKIVFKDPLCGLLEGADNLTPFGDPIEINYCLKHLLDPEIEKMSYLLKKSDKFPDEICLSYTIIRSVK